MEMNHVLVVEDDKEIREGVEIYLKSQGYEVFQAADGIEGLEVIEKEEIHLDEPVIIKQGSRYGVKIRSEAPSIHMIRANIETEIAPIVGSEKQAEDLVAYIKKESEGPQGVWGTNIFGKSIEDLVMDGMRNKITLINEESQVKLQDSMQKIVNDSNGGLVCIII